MDLIVFHNNCPDGTTAAYIAKLRYPDAELLPRDHGVEPPYDLVKDKDVLVVDFSWRTREQNDKLASLAKSFRILDHHKTAEAVLAGAPYATFDMNRSGAGLAWDYLFGNDCEPISTAWNPLALLVPRPWWVNYVEDRDLWRFNLPDSHAVNNYIMTFPYTIEGWLTMTKAPLSLAVQAGKDIQLQIDKYVCEAVKQAQRGHLNLNNKQYTVAIVNVPYINCSEVGHVLSETADVGLSWFERSDGVIQFSARSRGDIDVSEIAKQFNGGGHLHAAGWQMSVTEGRRLVDSILGRGVVDFLLL